MGFLKQFRSSLENPQSPLSFPAEWLLDIFNGGRTDAGIRVSELTALQVTTVYTCVDLISGSLASLDLNVYEQLEPKGKRIAYNHDVHWLLHDEPNVEMTSFSFFRTLQCHALLWSNAYAEIQRDYQGRPVALWPRMPHATRPIRLLQREFISGEWVEPGTMAYETTDGQTLGPNQGATPRHILASDMIHIQGLSLDGRLGKPIIELARQAIGLALAAEKFGGKFFANGLRPSGVFELPNDMSPQAIENFRRSVQEAYGGENMLRPLVAEAGIKWQQSDVKPDNAQFLQTRVHQREEIGALFRVPIRMLGEGSRVNRATAEQEGTELVQYTLRPWLKSWQPELKRKLFPRTGRSAGKYFPAFYWRDMLTPDAESQGKLIALLRQWGISDADTIREEILDWNPLPNGLGRKIWQPVNMVNVGDPIPPVPGKKPGDQPDEGQPGGADDRAAIDAYFQRIEADLTSVSSLCGRPKPTNNGVPKEAVK